MVVKLDPTSAAFGEPAGHSFQEINLDDSAPQLDLSFESTKGTSGGGGYGFGGWGKDWNTGSKWGFGSMGNDTSTTKEPPVKESAWGLGDKKTKKASGSLGFDLGDLRTSTADIGTSKEVKDDDTWGSFATVGRNSKKKKDSITETDSNAAGLDIEKRRPK